LLLSQSVFYNSLPLVTKKQKIKAVELTTAFLFGFCDNICISLLHIAAF